MTEKVKQHYNQWSGFYGSVMDGMRSKSTRHSLLANFPKDIPNNARVLDIGCGTGISSKTISERYPEATIVGLDFAEQMLAKHRKKHPAIPLIYGDFTNEHSFLSYPDLSPISLQPMSFDLIVSAGAISEYSDVAKTLPWLLSLLKPGGWLVNAGVQDSSMGRMTGRIWRFKPTGSDEFIDASKKTGFVNVTPGVVPKNAYLKEHEEYVVIAQAPDQ